MDALLIAENLDFLCYLFYTRETTILIKEPSS